MKVTRTRRGRRSLALRPPTPWQRVLLRKPGGHRATSCITCAAATTCSGGKCRFGFCEAQRAVRRVEPLALVALSSASWPPRVGAASPGAPAATRCPPIPPRRSSRTTFHGTNSPTHRRGRGPWYGAGRAAWHRRRPTAPRTPPPTSRSSTPAPPRRRSISRPSCPCSMPTAGSRRCP